MVDSEPSPVETILNEIEQALSKELYYLAIAVALTLPDICAGLEADDARTTPKKYADWYKSNLSKTFSQLTGDDCYGLRCGIVHQARADRSQHGAVQFALPGNVAVTNSVLKGGYCYDAEHFCREIISAVRVWYADHKGDANVIKNMPKLVRYRPDGFAGNTFPVIA